MELLNLFDWHIVYPLIISACIGALFGLERELAGKDPGPRTFMLICMGSCIFSMLSYSVGLDRPNADPARISAQIVTGIGFLGAGTIFRSTNRVTGLTTAALMWVTSSLGMAVGFKRLDIAISASVVGLGAMTILRTLHGVSEKIRNQKQEVD